MDKINLNFFGEEVTINTPEDIPSLRRQISEKYFFSNSDVAEIILYYVKDSKKVYIINGNDFSLFKESKIPTLFLDVNQNSKLYLDNVCQLKKEKEAKTEEKEEKKVEEDKVEEVKVEEVKVEEIKVEEKKEEIDIEKEKKEIEKLNLEKAEIDKQMKEKNNLYNDKISFLVKQIVEMEQLKNDLSLERDLDMAEFRDKKKEIEQKIDEIKKKIEPKKEEIILKAAPKPVSKGGYQFRSGQNNFPYSQAALKANFENQRKYMERFNAAKEKRMKERKALAEKKALEEKNEVILKSAKINMPDVIPIFSKVNDVLNKTVQRVKLMATEKVMTKEERIAASKEDNVKRQKEKAKKEQIDKIIKIARDAVKEINDLTKLVIDQSNSLIERINNPQLYRSSSSDDILLRAAPKIEKKVKPEIHYNVTCDGCNVTPLRGNRYKCKKCKDFDFCEDCYKKNKESHGHDFFVIEHPRCRNRLGHPNKKYCQRGIVHSNVMCDGCGMLPLAGWRYKCALCDDYSLCENCEERIGGKHCHPFIKITSPLELEKFNNNYLKLNSYDPNKKD